jgi:hypothetical protein
MQLWVALSRRILASSCACTEFTISTPTFSHSGRPAMKSSSITHWMKLSPMRAARSSRPVAALTRSATSGVGRGVMRSTMALGLVVFASTQACRALSPSASMNCSRPPRERSPLWRRLSQFISVTGPVPACLRARRMLTRPP